MFAVAMSAIGLLASLPAAAWNYGPVRQAAVSRMAMTLETRFPWTDLPQDRHVTGIIVLGGNPSRARHAITLARLFPDATVILSGPGADEIKVLESTPDVARQLIVDRRPTTTFENAKFSHRLARPGPNDHWILVTSAIHMPRSIGAFRSVGFNVHPSPVQDTPPVNTGAAAGAILHEVLGLAYYRALGRSNALFPGNAS